MFQRTVKKKKVALNCRLLSLTVVVCEMIGEIIRKQIKDFLIGRNYLSERHHGFRKKRSCMTNLLDIYERTSNPLGKRRSFMMKPNFLACFRGRAYELILSYLAGRAEKT